MLMSHKNWNAPDQRAGVMQSSHWKCRSSHAGSPTLIADTLVFAIRELNLSIVRIRKAPSCRLSPVRLVHHLAYFVAVAETARAEDHHRKSGKLVISSLEYSAAASRLFEYWWRSPSCLGKYLIVSEFISFFCSTFQGAH